MASEVLSIITRVQGAVETARDIGKIGTAIDTVSTKATGLRGKLGAIGGKVGGFLSSTGIGDQISMMAIDASARAVRDTYEQVQAQTAAATKQVTSTGQDFLKSNPTIDQLNTSIAGIEKGMEDIKANPLTFFVGGGDAMKELVKLRADYQRQRDTIMQEGADTERALRSNAGAIVAAINGLDLSVSVYSAVTANVTFQDVIDSQSTADRYTGGSPAPTYSH